MRYAARTDANQARIVKGLRAIGASVHTTHMVGDGFPDIEVGYRGRNWLFEIKDPDAPKADQQLTPAQKTWHASWHGQVHVIRTLDEAISLITSREPA